MNVEHLVTSLGYWAVFTLVAAESLGIPLPGETVLIAAGAYAGSGHSLSPWLIFAVAATAVIIGDNIGYWVGAKGGYRLLRRYGNRVRIDERKLKAGRYIFDRHGAKVVFLGRFVSVLRTYAALLAGTNRMQWRRFSLANASGGVLWAGIYTLASYEAGKSLRHLNGTIDVALAGAAVLTMFVVVLAVRHTIGSVADKAELAYPGPLELTAPFPASEEHGSRPGDQQVDENADVPESVDGSSTTRLGVVDGRTTGPSWTTQHWACHEIIEVVRKERTTPFCR